MIDSVELYFAKVTYLKIMFISRYILKVCFDLENKQIFENHVFLFETASILDILHTCV